MTTGNFSSLSAVTGAYSYTGKYIARKLLECGERVITLTGHPDRPDPFSGQVRAYPYNFEDPAALAASLAGVKTLYNTYWVRFDYGAVTYERAVENTLVLIEAARQAGVERLVHVSIANPSLDSPFPYYRGKAQVEAAIQASGLSYAILRPTVIFGREDILINNIAYLLRKFPQFAIPGKGEYRLQPVFVEDMAELAAAAGAEPQNSIHDVVGPEIYSFVELVRRIQAAVDGRARLIHLPPKLALLASRQISRLIGDVVLTGDELDGLMANLLVSSAPPLGKSLFSHWVVENKELLGKCYASELGRHYRD
jgi:NADH dehydrogenase